MARDRISGAVFHNGRTYRRGDEKALAADLDALEGASIDAKTKTDARTRSVNRLGEMGVIQGFGFSGKVKKAEISDLDPTLAAKRRNSDTDEIEDEDEEHEVIDAPVVDETAEDEEEVETPKRKRSTTTRRERRR